jgi:hypothetical protein
LEALLSKYRDPTQTISKEVKTLVDNLDECVHHHRSTVVRVEIQFPTGISRERKQKYS